jgi:hypothetical protein
VPAISVAFFMRVVRTVAALLPKLQTVAVILNGFGVRVMIVAMLLAPCTQAVFVRMKFAVSALKVHRQLHAEHKALQAAPSSCDVLLEAHCRVCCVCQHCCLVCFVDPLLCIGGVQHSGCDTTICSALTCLPTS